MPDETGWPWTLDDEAAPEPPKVIIGVDVGRPGSDETIVIYTPNGNYPGDLVFSPYPTVMIPGKKSEKITIEGKPLTKEQAAIVAEALSLFHHGKPIQLPQKGTIE